MKHSRIAMMVGVLTLTPLGAEVELRYRTPLILAVTAASCPALDYDINGLGEGLTLVRLHIDRNGAFHGGFTLNGHGWGVDTAGNEWSFTDADSFSFNGFLGSEPVEFTQTENFRFISKGGAKNVTVHALVHVRVLPDGQVVVSFEKARGSSDEACEGIFEP